MATAEVVLDKRGRYTTGTVYSRGFSGEPLGRQCYEKPVCNRKPLDRKIYVNELLLSKVNCFSHGNGSKVMFFIIIHPDFGGPVK